MQYQTHHINKELLQWMPIAAFEGEVIVVDREEQIADAVPEDSRRILMTAGLVEE